LTSKDEVPRVVGVPVKVPVEELMLNQEGAVVNEYVNVSLSASVACIVAL
jgi:hypothetical protein